MHKRYLFYTPIVMLLAIGFFVINNIANAVLRVPPSYIEGVVYDSISKKRLANVTVKIDDQLGKVLTTTTNTNGYYKMEYGDCLPSGDVNVSADLEGYKPFSATIQGLCGVVQFDIYLKPDIKIEPVIVIPGIMGSWNRQELNKIPYFPFFPKNEWELDPIFGTYDFLIDSLQSAGGYVLYKNLFPMPYDWRVDNRFVANYLKSRINDIKQQTGADKVDIIAHSMGGLIARYYIESDQYQDDVDQVIFIGTPHRGAPKAYLAWEGGYSGTNLETDFIKELVLYQMAVVNGHSSIFNYITKEPIISLQQLLPDYPYLTDANTGNLIPYSPGNGKYPYNNFLINLNNPNKIDLFTNRVNESYIIYGDNLETITRYKVVPYTGNDLKWQHGYPEGFDYVNRKNGIIFGAGDKTVPTFSATDFPATKKIKKYQTSHSQIVSDAVSDIIYILRNKQVVITPKESYTDFLLVQVYSPIDIQIISPDGKKLGVDFANNIEINEIKNAYYSGLGSEVEFALIRNPEPGEYKLITQGTGNGSFAIDVSFVNENGVNTKRVQGNAIRNMQNNFDISLSANGELQVKSEDKIPPQIIINSPLPQNYLHSDIINIDYQVSDDNTGVEKVEQYLNNLPLNQNKIDLFNYNLGEYQFKIKATDKAGNQSEKIVQFQIIATFSSLQKDIERLFAEGDIKNKKTKNYIIKLIEKFESYKNKLDRKSQKRKYSNKDTQKDREKLQRELDKINEKLTKLFEKGKINNKAKEMIMEQLEFLLNDK